MSIARTAITTAAIAAATAVGLAVAAPASAATTAKKPPAPLAHTSQTLTFSNGGPHDTVTIDFGASTFKVPQFHDKGTFTNDASSLTLDVKKSRTGDTGCMFAASYKTQTATYAGTYTCPGDVTGTFSVTTDGSAPS